MSENIEPQETPRIEPTVEPPINVAEVMSEAKEEGVALTGPVSSEPYEGHAEEHTTEGPTGGIGYEDPAAQNGKKRRGGGRKRDPLIDAIRAGKPGKIMVGLENAIYRACEADILNPEEAEALDAATEAFAIDLARATDNPTKVTPAALFALAALAPLVARAVPVTKAATPLVVQLWEKALEVGSNIYEWASRFWRRKPPQEDGSTGLN